MTTVLVPEFSSELGPIRDALATARKIAVVVPEGDIYPRDATLAQIAFATEEVAFTLTTDLWRNFIREILSDDSRQLIVHNAAHTMEMLDRHIGVTIEELAGRTFDTRILAHLLDPRERKEGGTGHTFDDVLRMLGYAAPTMNRTADPELLAVRAHLTLALIGPLHEGVVNAGVDHLVTREHTLQAITSTMARRGVLVDRARTENLHRELTAETERWAAQAVRYGVSNLHNNGQVSASLVAMGEALTERTGDGGLKVDKAVLLPLADLDDNGRRLNVRKPNPLAEAIIQGRRASHWSASYTGAFLSQADKDGRLHAAITTLAARTGRMSLSRPALQQLPSSDWQIRHCIVADPGHAIISVDFKQIEMRVLAALCRDERMLEAILAGVDLHSFTAEHVFGAGFTKEQRETSKQIGFSKVYGGGPDHIAAKAGVPVAQVRPALAAYDELFPGIKAYGSKLIAEARRRDRFEVVNVNGRILPLDENRSYAALNYAIQSVARDILADAILRVYEAGYGDRLLLPIHDELLATAPIEEAEAFAQKLRELMETTFMGVPILADAEVYGSSWGSGYGAPPDN